MRKFTSLFVEADFEDIESGMIGLITLRRVYSECEQSENGLISG